MYIYIVRRIGVALNGQRTRWPDTKNKTRWRCCCMTHHTILCIQHAVDELIVCTTCHAVGRKARRRHVPTNRHTRQKKTCWPLILLHLVGMYCDAGRRHCRSSSTRGRLLACASGKGRPRSQATIGQAAVASDTLEFWSRMRWRASATPASST